MDSPAASKRGLTYAGIYLHNRRVGRWRARWARSSRKGVRYAVIYLPDNRMNADGGGMDAVFKALADPTRRLLLDRLREHNGQTLRELCERVGMARQSVTQHLDLLVRADLVVVVRRGRERLHYLNTVPIHEIEERWISGFDKGRLNVISAVKNQAEEYAMTDTAS